MNQKQKLNFIKESIVMVIAFKDGKRVGTISGINVITAAQEITKWSKYGCTCIMLEDNFLGVLESILWDQKELEKIIKTKRRDNK